MPSRGPATDEIAALYRLPLREFTAARDALAAGLKGAGDAAGAASVKALVKPTLSAWVVNQLYWLERAKFDELLAAVTALRAAHRARAELRAPLEARRRALSTLSQRGAELLRDGGGSPTPDMTRRVATTLEAVATLGMTPGQLSRDLDPPGFEALAGLGGPQAAPAAAKVQRDTPTSRVLPFAAPAARAGGRQGDRVGERRLAAEREAERAVARRAIVAAEADLDSARELARQTAQDHAAARARVETNRREMEKLERDLVATRAAAKAGVDDARRLEREANLAAKAQAEAERRLQQARRELETA